MEAEAPPGGGDAGDGGEMVIGGCSLGAPPPPPGGGGYWGPFHGWDEHHEEEENKDEEDRSWGAWSPKRCRPSDSWAECELWAGQAEGAAAPAPRRGARARFWAPRSAPMRELRSPSPARRPHARDGCGSKGLSGDRSSGKGHGSKGMYWLGGSGYDSGKDKCGKGKGGEGKSKSKGSKDKGKGGKRSGKGGEDKGKGVGKGASASSGDSMQGASKRRRAER